MKVRDAIGYLLLSAYTTVTVAALAYTLLRIPIPFIPPSLTHYSYAMMAPFQGTAMETNTDVLAEGKHSNGTWQQIDLAPYLPYGHGEANARMQLASFYRLNRREEKFLELAKTLQQLEAQKGHEWSAIRFTVRRWERSPGGFSYLRTPLFTTNELMIEYP